MGLAMAKNLQTHLTTTAPGAAPLAFTNRTLARGAALAALGAAPRETVAQVVRESDVVFVSVSDDEALNAVVAQIVAAAGGHGEDGVVGGRIVVDTTTVHPQTSAAVARRLAAVGVAFVAAPVFGPSPTAEEGKLLVAVAGPADAVAKVEPFLTGVIARGVIRAGEDVAKATLLKTCGNFIVAGVMEIVAEAHVLAEKSGLGSDVLEALLQENFGTLAYSDSRRLMTGVYAPARGEPAWSDLDLAIKDVGHGISCAREAGTRLKVAEVALDHLTRAKEFADAQGGRTLDSSSMYGVVRQEAGLDFETDLVKERDRT